jgi:hypothetical protein
MAIGHVLNSAGDYAHQPYLRRIGSFGERTHLVMTPIVSFFVPRAGASDPRI